MSNVILFNPSIATSNVGDRIIVFLSVVHSNAESGMFLSGFAGIIFITVFFLFANYEGSYNDIEMKA